MQKIEKLYRKDYKGETILKELVYSEHTWHRVTEYVPNNIINNQLSNKAVVLGNGPSRTELHPDLFRLLKEHKGGLLSAGKVQTYGCNALIRDFTPDFLVANGDDIITEMVNSQYTNRTITYANANAILTYPNKFYLIPQNPSWDAGAIAAYLACFDGHKQVYLMGFDGHSGESNYNYNVYSGTNGYPAARSHNQEAFLTKSMLEVMNTYSDVDFVRVMPLDSWYMPDEWKYQLNLRQINFRDFVLEADL